MKLGIMGKHPAKPYTIERAEIRAKRIKEALKETKTKRQWTLPNMKP